MKKLFFIILCVSGMVLSGCSTYQYQYEYSSREARVARPDIHATPTVVDVRADYSKRIEVVSEWHQTREEAMDECRYLAITRHNVDIVVDPIFKIENRIGNINGYKATLTGFGGYYTNPRTMFEDIEALKKFSKEDLEKYMIMHNPAVLQYLNPHTKGASIHTNGEGSRESGRRAKAEEPRQASPSKSSQQTTKTVVKTTTIQSSQPTQVSQPSEQVQQQSAQPQRSVEPQQTVSEEKPKTGFRKRKQ
jgi:hypothetical protein